MSGDNDNLTNRFDKTITKFQKENKLNVERDIFVSSQILNNARIEISSGSLQLDQSHLEKKAFEKDANKFSVIFKSNSFFHYIVMIETLHAGAFYFQSVKFVK